jgi:hypothetical protein
MAKIGVSKNRSYEFSFWWKIYSIVFTGLVISILTIFYMSSEQESSSVVVLDVIKAKNKNMLCRKVNYNSFVKTDPKDTSDVYFEVTIPDPKGEYSQGDLVKFNYRFIEEVQVDGIVYCVLNPDNVQFVIEKKDVKNSLLRR